MATATTPAPALLATRFIVSSSALLARVQDAAQFVTGNPVVPILENLLFDVADGQLTLTGSDLESTFITAPLAVEASSSAPMRMAIPARILLDTLKGLPDQPVTLELNAENYHVTLHSANGRYKLAGENPADFPKPSAMHTGKTSELPAAALLLALRHTLPFVSGDELRPAMCGVLFQLEMERLTCVATDGHRLVRHRALGLQLDGAFTFIVPKKPLQYLVKLVGNTTTLRMRHHVAAVRFELERGTLHTRLIDERYPDYENVIPISSENHLLIDRAQLLGAAKRIGIYANKSTHQTRLALAPAELQVSAEDLDFSNEASEKLPCQYEGADMEIGFNGRFLIEMLSLLDSAEVQLAMTTPNRAALLTPVPALDDVDLLMLVMPVMLNNYR
ncbi:DNA polymerase III subunit beta [Hymenobacter sp. 15J16-1T3B]|uniref:DNA polymerase III subunit beta n=1 Tax=Hymenobacter sp. 15J16-1T3B TaxID=2886941 RepID=UPI001D10D5C6|nr:DNA polymerase III subunit beta [Hymenobacter sp. 15J16-1T3B]MCC3159488.1 DNA polymerase III subunit beta [Hymenobacter sp. 15J16-1T3B]